MQKMTRNNAFEAPSKEAAIPSGGVPPLYLNNFAKSWIRCRVFGESKLDMLIIPKDGGLNIIYGINF